MILAVAFVGFVSAMDTAHPPGVLTINMSDTLEAALYGDSADDRAVTPSTVLVEALPVTTTELSSYQAVMANYEEIAIQPQGGAIPVINTGQFFGEPETEETIAKTIAETDYHLLC